MSGQTCFQCGNCCRNYFCIVPKNEDSNLSDEFLQQYSDEHSYEATQEYINQNQQIQGEKCKWLHQNYSIKQGDNFNEVAYCTAYNRRSNMCSGHMEDQYCNTGLAAWRQHKNNGHEVPSIIMEKIKKHPFFDTYWE
jgi:Fe-S-cluster containining protein